MSESPQIDLQISEVVSLVIRSWRAIAAVVVVAAAAAVGSTFLMEPVYRAEVVVSPVGSADSRGLLAGLAGGLGGLASTLGVSLPSDSDSNESWGMINSRYLIDKFIARGDLLQTLYHKRWDASTASWKSSRLSPTPTQWLATKMFMDDVRAIAKDAKTGLITVSIDWRDREVAASWANELVALANEELRGRAIAESERNIAYLNEQLTKTNVVELRSSMFKLMEEQIKKAMIARGSQEFAFRVIDPAVAPEKKIKPKPVLMGVVGALIGGLLAVFVVVQRGYRRKATALTSSAS